MKRQKTAARKWLPYPQEDHLRSGCKVSWHYYRDREIAEQCAKIAEHNREIAWDQGYDFGYCLPGTIAGPDNGWHPGFYEVCTC